MKRSLLILGLFLASVGQAISQNYFVISKIGTTSDYNFNTQGTKILSAPANDVMSPSQTLPFTFNFYGQPMTSFEASDNGYITFNTTTTVSNHKKHLLPDTASPKNSIFGMWQDLALQNETNGSNTYPSYINTFTYGTAPNRVFVIQWMLSVPNGTTATAQVFAYHAIRLYEQGYFDVVHDYGYGSGYDFEVGCQNSDGTLGTNTVGSPDVYLGWSNGGYDPSTSRVFEFHYASLDNDIAIQSLGISPTNYPLYKRTVQTYIKGDAMNFGGTIYNYGKRSIKSYTLNYSIDGGAPVSQSKTTSLDSFGGTESLSLPTWTVANPGQFHNVKVWVSSVNGKPIVDSSSNSGLYNIFVINGGNDNLIMKPLVENCTGAWCPYCSDGHIDIDNVVTNNPNAVALCYHYVDQMSIASDYTLCGAYISSYPSILVNRKEYNGAGSPALTHAGTNDNPTLDAAVTQEVNNNASIPVTLDITSKTWDPATREITFTVAGKFADYAGGDVRLSAIIAEDSVRGPNLAAPDPPSLSNAGWNQANAYSKNWAAVGGAASLLYNEPQYIVGYVQNEVVEAVLNGDWGGNLTGFAGPNAIIPPNTTFSKTFTYKLPAQVNVNYSKTIKTPDATAYHSTYSGYGYYKPESINLVAFIANYNANDASYGEILNAAEQPLFGWSTGVGKYNTNLGKVSVYPNPTANNAKIEYTITEPTDLTIEIYNVMGQKVMNVQSGTQIAGTHTLSVDASNLNSGLYFVSFTSNGAKTTKQLMIQK